MIQHLYWIEPEDKWRSRGYANHLHLYVDYANKQYELRTEMSVPKGSDNDIEVKSKGCLKKYIGYLDKFGFSKGIIKA